MNEGYKRLFKINVNTARPNNRFNDKIHYMLGIAVS
jgi:hypothetical protein